MGVDKRGKERGGCNECDCSDYEQSQSKLNCKCWYCDCPPTKHELLGHDKNARPTKRTDKLTEIPLKHIETSSTEFNDLPKAGTFPHDEWTKIDTLKNDLKLEKPSDKDKPFLVESLAPEKEDERDDESDKLSGSNPVSASFLTASQPLQKKPDKVNRRENARAASPPKRRQNSSGEKAGTPPRRSAAGRAAKKKSAAVKVHNLDQIMSSHLADKRTAERIDQMFQNFDDDGSNELDREECTQLTGYILEQCGLQADIIPSFVYDEAFKKYDDDGGGTITLHEFREFLMSHLKK